MQHVHYFLSPILIYDGTDLKAALTRALVSRSGVYKVFEDSQETYRAFITGKLFRVRLDGSEYRARLVRESGPGGIHYNLHLLDSNQEFKMHLQGLLGRFGFESPWKRDFARISAGSVILKVETPISAHFSRFSGDAIGDVRNFSYHGLFVELHCSYPSMSETVGQTARFRLMTSKGRILEGMTGKIARIYDEMTKPGEMKRGLGLRILSMTEGGRKAYHSMILESCRELQANGKISI